MQVVVDFVRQIVSEINQNILAVVVEKRDKQEVPNIKVILSDERASKCF